MRGAHPEDTNAVSENVPERRPRNPPRALTVPEAPAPSFAEGLIETLVARASSREREEARAAFEARGGAFTTADTFHEERIRAFSDELVCAYRGASGLTLAEQAAAELPTADTSEAGAWVRALTRSERSIYRVELAAAGPAIRCLLGGSVLLVRLDADPREPSARLREGDVFDGRAVPVRDEVRVLPGMIFHREEAHDALFALVPQALSRGMSRTAIVDGLLRMRMRHDRFTSIHARHLYRVDALTTREIQAASWKPPRPE